VVKVNDDMNTLMTTKINLRYLCDIKVVMDVVTLAFGLRPRQGLARVQAKREVQESHLMFLGV
jgi:hypothetical protein